jgi:hypothetical protein
MRAGDFSVEVVAERDGRVRELESGHVLARPGSVYRLRLRNFGPLYCVVSVDIDGRRVTGGGLVLEPWGTTELERPIDDREHGRFTVFAEGDETVFGADGGRDNASLGLIEAAFRRELPGPESRSAVLPPAVPLRVPLSRSESFSRFSRRSIRPDAREAGFTALRAPEWLPDSASDGEVADDSAIERAAGTGLTGHSDQRFVPIHLGPLEPEATVIRLRLVIGTEEALAEESRSLDTLHEAPARPAARP